MIANPTFPPAKGRPRVSFEFFPPKSEKMEAALKDTVLKLAPLAPQFVSVTYGADGSTRDRTLGVIRHVLDETPLNAAAHLTCVGADRAEIDALVAEYWRLGVRHIVALRGDPPAGAGGYRPHPGGYAGAAELVAGVRAVGDFEVSVSAYPEKHPESADLEADFDNLKRKIDNGATRAITQFFFSNDTYLSYVEAARARGIDIPIVPGILPIENFTRASGFAEKCGTTIPDSVRARFEGLEDDPETHRLVAAVFAAEQVQGLREAGVEDFHFYTLNRPELVTATCRLLGISAPTGTREAADA